MKDRLFKVAVIVIDNLVARPLVWLMSRGGWK